MKNFVMDVDLYCEEFCDGCGRPNLYCEELLILMDVDLYCE